jgi:hypothetical protein
LTNNYTEQEINILKENYSTKTRDEMEKLLPNRTWHSMRDLASELKLHRQNIKILDQKKADNNYDKTWDLIEQLQTELKAKSVEQDSITVDVGDGWHGVVFLGDLHIGSVYLDYDALKKDIADLSVAENISIVLCGDLYDNFVHPNIIGASFGEIIQPRWQKELVCDVVRKLGNKITGIIIGTHEQLSIDMDDFNMGEYLAQHIAHRAYLGYGGFIDLHVGSQVYRILARHSFRFESSLNPCNAVRRMFSEIGEYDCAVLAHKHQYNCEWGILGGKPRIFIRTGTFKIKDAYAESIGFTNSTYGVPIVLFNPNERQMLAFPLFRDGIKYLSFLRNEGA